MTVMCHLRIKLKRNSLVSACTFLGITRWKLLILFSLVCSPIIFNNLIIEIKLGHSVLAI